MRRNLYTPYKGIRLLWGLSPPVSEVFGSLAVIVVPLVTSPRNPAGEFPDHPVIADAFAATCEWLANSPSAHGFNSEGELANVTGTVGQLILWKTKTSQSGCLSATAGPTKFPSLADETCCEATVNISFGKNQPHNNLSPLYGVYRFRRTSWCAWSDIRHKVVVSCYEVSFRLYFLQGLDISFY